MNQVPVTSPGTIYTYTHTNPARYPTRPRFGPVSPSEQPDRPGFRANFSHWRPVGFNSSGLEATQNPPDLRSSGFDNLRTDHMCGAMPILTIAHPAYFPSFKTIGGGSEHQYYR